MQEPRFHLRSRCLGANRWVRFVELPFAGVQQISGCRNNSSTAAATASFNPAWSGASSEEISTPASKSVSCLAAPDRTATAELYLLKLQEASEASSTAWRYRGSTGTGRGGGFLPFFVTYRSTSRRLERPVEFRVSPIRGSVVQMFQRVAFGTAHRNSRAGGVARPISSWARSVVVCTAVAFFFIAPSCHLSGRVAS